MIAAAQAVTPAGTPQAGRYACVLTGQGACSEENICLGNRISRDDRNVRLVLDFTERTASLNGLKGRLATEDDVTYLRWNLSMMRDWRINFWRRDRDYVAQLGTEGGGPTAEFACKASR